LNTKKSHKYLCGLFILSLLAGCGGGGNGDVQSETPAGISTVIQGVAVDPYIVGAVFQEIDENGSTVLQRQSSPSDEFGVFSFPNPVAIGSIIEIKISNKGLHGGAPFKGMLRRSIGADDHLSVNVTPLTTWLANGISEADVLQSLLNAGFTGLTVADLYSNPMTDRSGDSTKDLLQMISGVSNRTLLCLQANMAVNDYMEITGNYQATGDDLNTYDQTEILNSVAEAVRSRLNAAEFIRITTALAQDPQLTGQPTLGDLIMTVLQQQQTLVALVRENMAANGTFNPNLVEHTVQDGLTQVVGQVRTRYMARVPSSSSPANGTDGVALYTDNCTMCHNGLATSNKKNSSAAQIQAAIDNNVGNMNFLNTLTSVEIQAIADALITAQENPPASPANGQNLYADNCAGCHASLATTLKPGRTAANIQAAINNNVGNMGSLNTLTAAEVQAIADLLPAAHQTDPTTQPDGVVLYNSECAGCHSPLNNSTKPGRTATQIQTAIDYNIGSMGSLGTLTASEVQAIADVLPAAQASNPITPPDGAALYSSDCATCHGTLANTSKPGRTATQIQTAIDNNIGSMGSLSTLTASEVQAIADVLPAAQASNPITPPDGAALYSSDCATCHGTLANTSKPGRTATQIQAAIDNNVGNMGSLNTLTASEVQAIADVLPTAPASGPDYSDCTACHSQPPSGNSYPDTAGAHAAHANLPSVNYNCGICHVGAAHNGQLDLGFPIVYNAKNGTATDNVNGTCSSVSCHGGQTTPIWETGSIVVDTQCTSCHASGTTHYNSYSSGRHSKHLGMGYACTVCHNTSTLQAGHFSNLATTTFEQSPAATVGGGSTSVGLYQGGSCSSIRCHGSERW
jgi:predicted CxxxxCH...CXXCH cytochrome family protein